MDCKKLTLDAFLVCDIIAVSAGCGRTPTAEHNIEWTNAMPAKSLEHRRKIAIANTTHGHSQVPKPNGKKGSSPTYQSWKDMIQRCTNPARWSWRYYGGRGIRVCARWLSFESFLQDMGEKPTGLTLERSNNDGNYCPENCRWATRKEQSQNCRHTRIMTVAGVTGNMRELCAHFGISNVSVYKRLKKGWPIESAFLIAPR